MRDAKIKAPGGLNAGGLISSRWPLHGKLRDIEYRLFGVFQRMAIDARIDWRQEKILVACSGGLDSVALTACLSALAPKLGFSLAVATVDHGPSSDPSVMRARKDARVCARRLALALNLPFHSVRVRRQAARELRSEQELRRHRLRALEWLRRRKGCTRIAFAHHAEDLLETRLIRLIRGTGPQGLTAMREFGPEPALRPFLLLARLEIEAYAKSRDLQWHEDPTNRSVQPLRNWLRLEWLPALECKRPGAGAALARSLDHCASLAERTSFESDRPKLSRRTLSDLSAAGGRQEVAGFLLANGIRNFSSRHIEEILKRLGTPRREFQFQLLRLVWTVNAEHVRVRRMQNAQA